MGGLSKYYRQRLSLFSRPEYNTGVLYSISTCLPAPDRQAGRMRHMFRLMWGCRAHTTGPGPKSRPYSATVRFAGIIITTESLGKWGIYGRGHCSPVRILSVFCLRSFWRQRHYWVALCLKTETYWEMINEIQHTESRKPDSKDTHIIFCSSPWCLALIYSHCFS